MAKPGNTPIKVPNPHKDLAGGISVEQISKILRGAGINRDDWINA